MLATVFISVRLCFVFRSLLLLFIGMLAGCRGWVAVDVLQVICLSGVGFSVFVGASYKQVRIRNTGIETLYTRDLAM